VDGVGDVARVDGQSFVNHHRAQARTSRSFADAVIASQLRFKNNTTQITPTTHSANNNLSLEAFAWN
jgi:hypothetical protein